LFLKILVVDDERFYINVLVELLQNDYQLYIAKSGEQALKRIADNPPDLILLDIMMPEMDGYL
jgi:putative two-component system response regulator